eukprot:7940057-Pyramimonas_sp.AAC.1
MRGPRAHCRASSCSAATGVPPRRRRRACTLLAKHFCGAPRRAPGPLRQAPSSGRLRRAASRVAMRTSRQRRITPAARGGVA